MSTFTIDLLTGKPLLLNVNLSSGSTTGSTGSVWGSILGTLSGQTDLQDALDSKLNISEFNIYSGLTNTRITNNDLDISYLSGQTDTKASILNLNSHTGNTDIHFEMSEITGFTSSDSFNNYSGLTNTRITNNENDIIYLSGNSSNYLPLSGGILTDGLSGTSINISGEYQISGNTILKLGKNTATAVYIGLSAGVDDSGTGNIGIGECSMCGSRNYSTDNVAIGACTLMNVSTDEHVAIGKRAMNCIGTGLSNIAVGPNTLFCNTNGDYNVAIGSRSQYLSHFANRNIGVGMCSLYRTADVDANSNIAIGVCSLVVNTAGSGNTSIGECSLSTNTTGHGNLALGLNAAIFAGSGVVGLTNATYSTFLGNSSRASADGNTNEIVIGYNTIGNGSNTITVGNDNIVSTCLKGTVYSDTTIVNIVGATTLDATHRNKIVEANGTFTITLPDGMPTGMRVDIINMGSGVITFAASTTLLSKASAVTLADQYGGGSVYHKGSNIWVLVGDLT